MYLFLSNSKKNFNEQQECQLLINRISSIGKDTNSANPNLNFLQAHRHNWKLNAWLGPRGQYLARGSSRIIPLEENVLFRPGEDIPSGKPGSVFLD